MIFDEFDGIFTYLEYPRIVELLHRSHVKLVETLIVELRHSTSTIWSVFLLSKKNFVRLHSWKDPDFSNVSICKKNFNVSFGKNDSKWTVVSWWIWNFSTFPDRVKLEFSFPILCWWRCFFDTRRCKILRETIEKDPFEFFESWYENLLTIFTLALLIIIKVDHRKVSLKEEKNHFRHRAVIVVAKFSSFRNKL